MVEGLGCSCHWLTGGCAYRVETIARAKRKGENTRVFRAIPSLYAALEKKV